MGLAHPSGVPITLKDMPRTRIVQSEQNAHSFFYACDTDFNFSALVNSESPLNSPLR
jgi:hypothetical protein